MKTFKQVLSAFMLLCICLVFTACPNKDDDPTASLQGWYVDLNNVAKSSDFNDINTAINSREVLSTYGYGSSKTQYIASRDLFINSNGMYHDTEAYFGRLRYKIKTSIVVIQVVDKNTIKRYVAYMYQYNKGKGDVVYKLNTGAVLGTMAYYGDAQVYTYAVNENKMIVSNGDIYTITSNGLIKDGSSSTLSKYDPNSTH